jgi:quercetin dioxygenase-like cupin family protein
MRLSAIAFAYRFNSYSAFPFDARWADCGFTATAASLGGRPNRGDHDMSRRFVQHMILAGITAGSTLLGVSVAVAGSCPSDKMKADARQPVTQAGKGVTDTVLAAIDLEREPANIKERQLRFRKLTIEPGGIVPWHSHGDRPAIIYIAEGEIVEYASNCSVPITHKAGEVRPETSGTSHWWQNLGNKTVVLFVGDVMHDKNDHNM